VGNVGKVIGVNGSTATVLFVRGKACAHCDVCLSFGDHQAVVDMENTLLAKDGDYVEISLHSRDRRKAGLIAQVIPCVALLLGAGLGAILGNLYVALGGIGFAASIWFIVRSLDPYFERKSEFKPRMLRIVQNEEGESWLAL